VRERVQSAQLIERYRVRATQWTRRRTLWIDVVICMILRGHKLPIQNALNKVFDSLGKIWTVPSASAYSQARHKLRGEVFLDLNSLVAEDFYSLWGAEGKVEHWRGYRVLGVDATRLTVPNTPATRHYYTLQQTYVPEGACVQAMLSVCFDVLNNIGVSAGLREICAEKEFLVTSHAEAFDTKDLVVLDRTYMDYGVLAYLTKRVGAFVIRVPHAGFTRVKEFWASEETDQVVTLRMPSSAKAFVDEQGLSDAVRVRFVKIALATGEIEVLATNLFDAEAVSRDDLKAVYWMRWGVETYFGHLKRIFEVERLGGEQVRTIEQDVFGIVFLATMESVLSKQADEELAERSQSREHKHTKQVNHSVSYSAMVDRAVDLICDRQLSAGEVYERLHAMFKTNPSSARPGRVVARRHVTRGRQVRHHRYRKRLIL
jgi:hypothetical protein